MTRFENHHAQNIIQTVAKKNNKTPEDVRQAMQEAMDAAWAVVWQPGNILGQMKWQQLFGCRKPSVEEFIWRVRTQLVKTDYLGARENAQ